MITADQLTRSFPIEDSLDVIHRQPGPRRVLEQAINIVCNPYQLPVAALLAARPDASILHHDQ